jgi:hypothetical protein
MLWVLTSGGMGTTPTGGASFTKRGGEGMMLERRVGAAGDSEGGGVPVEERAACRRGQLVAAERRPLGEPAAGTPPGAPGEPAQQALAAPEDPGLCWTQQESVAAVRASGVPGAPPGVPPEAAEAPKVPGLVEQGQHRECWGYLL